MMSPASRRRSSSASAPASSSSACVKTATDSSPREKRRSWWPSRSAVSALPDRVVEQRVRLLQVLDRGVAADERLDGAELEQQLGALGRRGRLGERAAQIGDGALRGTARARPARGLAQHRDDARIAGAGCEQQVRRHPFGLCPGGFEQPRRPRVPAVPLGRGERLVDGRPDQRMHEPERRLRAQDVDPGERDGRLGGGLVVQVGERGRLPGIGVVAQDRHRPRQPRRLRREAREAHRDGARAGPRPELAQARHVLLGRGQALGDDRVHELAQQQRIAARLLMAGGAEGVVGIGQGLAQQPGGGRRSSGERAERRVASGSETIWPKRPGSSPGSPGRRPTTTQTSSPSIRGSR